MEDDYTKRIAIPAKRGPGRPSNAEVAARQEMPAEVQPVTVIQHSVRCINCGIYVFPRTRDEDKPRRLCSCPRCGGTMIIKYAPDGRPVSVSRT